MTESKDEAPVQSDCSAAIVVALADACRELVQAMRDYEMDVDTDPPHTHREMMDRARAAIKAAEQ